MSVADDIRADRLIALAQERFEAELRPIETQILYHSCHFDDPPAEDAETKTEKDGNADRTVRPDAAWNGPEVRSRFLRWLVTDRDAQDLMEAKGLRVWNACISEPLDLRGCRTSVRVEFRNCLFREEIILISAEMPGLYLMNSTLLKGIEGTRLALHGPCFLWEVTVAGKIRLDQARIDAELCIERTNLGCTSTALSLGNARIQDNLQLVPSFVSRGQIYLDCAHIGGTLDLRGAEISSIHMVNADVGGQIDGRYIKLFGTGKVLTLDQSRIGGGVILRGKVVEPGDTVVSEDQTVVVGQISMRGSRIGGSLECDGANFESTDLALALDNARITGSVFLRNQFKSNGRINLHTAEIAGQVDCSGAEFTCVGRALSFEAARIGGHLLLHKGFQCFGEVYLLSASIGGQLSCDDSFIKVLTAENMDLKGDFFWRRIRKLEKNSINLTGAKIRSLCDDRVSWPECGNLRLNRLTVQELRQSNLDHIEIASFSNRKRALSSLAIDRILWLNLQAEADLSEPQPWIHMAKLLEDKGLRRDAKAAIFELRMHQAAANWKGRKFKRLGRAVSLAYARLEEQPLRILITVLLCVVLGSAIFWPLETHFAPTGESAYLAASKQSTGPVAYPKFQPIIYTLENVLPVVKFGQDDHWSPDAHRSSPLLYWFLMTARWSLILAGYVQGLILAAALSSRFRN